MNLQEATELYRANVLELIKSLNKNDPRQIKLKLIMPAEHASSLSMSFEDAFALGKAIAKNTTVKELDLSANNLDKQTALVIFENLNKNTSLRSLKLGSNGALTLTDKGFASPDDARKPFCSTLALLLTGNQSLERVVIDCMSDYYHEFEAALKVNYSLQDIDFNWETTKVIKAYLSRNHEIYRALILHEVTLLHIQTTLEKNVADLSKTDFKLQGAALKKIADLLLNEYGDIQTTKICKLRKTLAACEFKYACLTQDWATADRQLETMESGPNKSESIVFYVQSLARVKNFDSKTMNYTRLSLVQSDLQTSFDLHSTDLYLDLEKVTLGENPTNEATQAHQQLLIGSQDLPLSWSKRFRYFAERFEMMELKKMVSEQSAQIKALTQLVGTLQTSASPTSASLPQYRMFQGF